jgi:hypothetical protein
MEEMVAARAPSVKRYVVRLSADERRRLEAMIHKVKKFGGAASEGAHPVEGGRFRSRRRLERQPDRRGC